MVKKKNKKIFVSMDLNNLPTTSSATKIVKKPNNSINTSSDLSVTSGSSKANESVDSSSIKLGDEIWSDSQVEVKDDLCKSRGKSLSSKADETISSDHTENLMQYNQTKNSSECMNTQCYSEITDKVENMTLDSHSAMRRGSSEHRSKRSNDNNMHGTKSSPYHVRGGKDRHHSKTTSNSSYKDDRQNQRENFQTNRKKYETTHDNLNNYGEERTRYSQEKNEHRHWAVQKEVNKRTERKDVEGEPEIVAPEWDPIETGPSAHTKSFISTNQPGNERVENSKDEARQRKYTTSDDHWDDYSFDNNQQQSDRPYQERQQKRGGSLGRGQYEGNDHHENPRKKATTQYSKRYSEGSNGGKKETSGFIKPSSWGDAKTSRQSRDSFDRVFDDEYRKFQNEERSKSAVEFVRVSEIEQDLFAMATEYSLGHCVAEDMRMGSGIAVNFKRDFKDIDVLLNQRQKQGGLAILQQETEGGVRYIYYLVTKRVSNGKPTYETLWASLKKMRDHIQNHNVRKLAIPRLGCGLDRLEWSRVKHMIEFLFRDVQVEITVCNFQQTGDSPQKPYMLTCKIVNVEKPVADIEEETTIIYLSTVDGHVSRVMEQLSKKFSFLDEFKRTPKRLGGLIKYQVPKKYYVLYGCIVRETKKEPIDFVSLRKCISQVDKNCKKDQYVYVGIQAIEDDEDDLINEKLITILRNYLYRLDVYVCWDGDLVGQMPK